MRIAVVGTTGSGKTTFAQALSARLDIPHIELDALYWGPNWTATPDDLFQERTREAISADQWVCEGNYSAVRDLVWKRATGVIFLNYSFRRVFWQALRRTLRRAIAKEMVYGNNLEGLMIIDPQWTPWWVIRTYRRNRRLHAERLARPEFAGLEVTEFSEPEQAAAYLAGFPSRASNISSGVDCGGRPSGCRQRRTQ